MNRTIQHTYHIPGTLTANVSIPFKLYSDVSLVHVSAVGSNANDATLKIGNSSDDDAYLLAAGIGDSGAPVEFDRDNFVGGVDPHIKKGTTMLLTLDYDGAGGAAAQNVTLVLTFTEG